MSLLYGDKNKAISEAHYQLSRNKMLLKFLHYDKSDVDIVNAKELDRKQAESIWNNNIFKEEKFPTDLTTDVKCYVCISYGDKTYHNARNGHYSGSYLVIRVVCHKGLRACMNGDRVYAIEECIKNTFDNGNIGTSSSTELTKSKPFTLGGNDNGYSGVEILIEFVDKNSNMIGRLPR